MNRLLLTVALQLFATGLLLARGPTAASLVSTTVSKMNRTVPDFGEHAVAEVQVARAVEANAIALTNMTLTLAGATEPTDVAAIKIYFTGNAGHFRPLAPFACYTGAMSGAISLSGNQPLAPGVNHFWLAVEPRRGAKWGHHLDADVLSVGMSGADADPQTPKINGPSGFLTLGNAVYSMVLRDHWDDGAFEYRIPGLAVSTKGTLIALFDIRWDAHADLPANIDVGCMRSLNNGNTWGPMQTILDFDRNVVGAQGNGVGDPSVLVDRQTGAIWVAALWSFGNHSIAGSGPGLAPTQTGQFILTRSDDDGATWSPPVNITRQAKVNTNWGVCFPGPGKGIQLRGGALVFPSQYWDENHHSHCFFMYSTNHGESWFASPPANGHPPNCTESQIVELNSGQLMASSRNDEGSGRCAWSTYTPGATLGDGTWSPLTYANPAPGCQAGFIRYSSTLDGAPRNLLLFANPASKAARVNMTVRLSEDEGLSWTAARRIDNRPAAYSCLAVLPDGTVGLLYETEEARHIGALTFARFRLDWLTQAAPDAAAGDQPSPRARSALVR